MTYQARRTEIYKFDAFPENTVLTFLQKNKTTAGRIYYNCKIRCAENVQKTFEKSFRKYT